MLAALGLDPTTESVYRLMAAKPQGWGVDAIADHLELDPWQVREALDRLAELTLLRPSIQDPATWRAVSPQSGLQTLLQRQQQELDRRQRELSQSYGAVTRIIEELADSGATAPADSEHLIGLDAIQAKLEQFADQATTSVCTLMPGGAHAPAAIEAARELDGRLLQRGVAIRTLCLDSVRNHAPTLSYARWLTQAGAQVRTVPSLPLRMVLVDSRTALVPMDPAETSRGAIALSNPATTVAFAALFDLAWETGLPLGTTHNRHHSTGLTPAEQQLLKLLAQGLTDEAAGNHLSVSLSTVRRTMAALMERLGARSRFEAGLRAAEQGWL